MPVIYTYVWSVYIYLLKCMTVICVSCTCTLYMHTVRLCVHYVCFYVYMLCSCMPRHIKWNSGKTVRISLSIALYLMPARIQLQTTNIRESMFPHCAAHFHKNIIETLKGLCIWMHIHACRNVSARFYIHTLVHLFMHGFTYIYPHAATCLHIYPIPHIYTYMWMRICMLPFFHWIRKGVSADADPHYQKLYGRVTDVCSNRKSQPKSVCNEMASSWEIPLIDQICSPVR